MAEIEGFGAKLHYGTIGADPTALTTGWTVIAELTDITPPEPEADDIDTTSHDNTGHARTFQAGLIDSGEAELTAHYDKTVLSALAALIRSDKVFRIMFSDASAVSFNGYIKSVKPEIDMEGLTTTSLKIKVSGVVVYTAAVA